MQISGPGVTKGAVILFVLTVLYITVLQWKTEYDSCVRGNDIRTSYRAKQELDALRASSIAAGEHGHEKTVNLNYAGYYRDLAVATPKLACMKPLPDNVSERRFTVQDVLSQAKRGNPASNLQP
jgi:hypothetical protein